MRGRHNVPPTDDGGSDLISLLFRREDLLARLAEGPAEKHQLIDDLGVSRSTIDRSIKELEIEGLVEREAGGFTLTNYGNLSFLLYRKLLRNLTNVRRARISLEPLPPSAELDPVFFRDGTLISGRDDEGDRPAEFLRELIKGAVELRAITKSPHFELVTLAHQQVMNDGMVFEFIHSSDSIERLRIHHSNLLKNTLRSGNFDLYCLEETPPFGLMKVSRTDKETVALILYGRIGEPETMVTTETHAATERFDEFFRERRGNASQVELDGAGSLVIA